MSKLVSTKSDSINQLYENRHVYSGYALHGAETPVLNERTKTIDDRKIDCFSATFALCTYKRKLGTINRSGLCVLKYLHFISGRGSLELINFSEGEIGRKARRVLKFGGFYFYASRFVERFDYLLFCHCDMFGTVGISDL